MTSYRLVFHVVDHIHVVLSSHGIEVYYSSSSGEIAPAVGNQQQSQGVLVVSGKFSGQMLKLVIFIVGDEVANHEVFLIGSEV